MNFHQQSITTGKSVAVLEKEHFEKEIREHNSQLLRQKALDKLFGKGVKQDNK